MNLEEAIFKIVSSKLNFYYANEAKIISVSESKKTCTVIIDDDKNNEIKNVRWFSPGIPKNNTRCYILFIKNIFDRPVCISIQEFKSLKFKIGEMNEIEITDTNAKFKFQDVTIEKKATSLEIKNTSGLSLKMDTVSNKWIIEGDCEFSKDVKIKGKLDVDKKIKSLVDVVAVSTSLLKSKTATAIPGPPAPLTPEP